MNTETKTAEPTTAERAHRLDVALANLATALRQLRLLCDSISRGLEKMGHSSLDIQAVASFTLSCEIEAIEVSKQARLVAETKASETQAAPTAPVVTLH